MLFIIPCLLNPPPGSVFKCVWPQPPTEWNQTRLAAEFEVIRSVRAICNKALDIARSEKAIRSSLEASVRLTTDSPSLFSLLSEHEEVSSNNSVEFTLRDLLIVSGMTLSTNQVTDATQGYSLVETVYFNGEECKVQATAVCTDATNFKCPRCWKYNSGTDNCLCERCVSVVRDL